MQYETPVMEMIAIAADTAVANEVITDMAQLLSKIPTA